MAEEKGEGAEAIRDRNSRIREEAAAKRRSKREVSRRPATAQAQGLDAGEIMDDAFARSTHVAGIWIKRHLTVIQWVVVVGVIGGIGWQVYAHRRNKNEAKVSDVLFTGVTAEFARVADEGGEPDPQTGLEDTRPKQATDEARLQAAAAAYRATSNGETIRLLARLGLAGVLFDQGKYKEALVEYRAVRSSSLAEVDSDARARSAEGVGLSEEALGEFENARKAFRELESQDSAALSALGLYHQARLDHAKGDLEKAKERLKAALKKLETTKVSGDYLSQAARDLLAGIDPSAVPARMPGGMSPEQLEALQKQVAGGGPKDVTPEKLKELLDALGKTRPAPAGAPSGKPAGAP